MKNQLKNTGMFAKSFANQNSFEEEDDYQDAGDIDESSHNEKESRLSSHSFQFQAHRNLHRFSQLEPCFQKKEHENLNNLSALPHKQIDLSAFYSNASQRPMSCRPEENNRPRKMQT